MSVAAGSAPDIQGSFVVAAEEWTAIRVNSTDATDLQLRVILSTCDDGSPGAVHGMTIIIIRDGAGGLASVTPATAFWSAGEDFAEARVADVHVQPAVSGRDDGCKMMQAIAWGNTGYTTTTIIPISRFTEVRVDYEATWSVGSVEVDVARGPGYMRRITEFDTSTSAAIYPIASGSAALQARQVVSHDRDMVGWFSPQLQSPGVTFWECTIDAQPCTEGPSSYVLSSKGSSTWTMDVAAQAQAGRMPHYIMGAVPLPDDTYLCC